MGKMESLPPSVILNRITQGDCLQLLPQVTPKSVGLLLTDPPYGISKKHGLHTLNRTGIDFGGWDKDFDQYTWIATALPALKPGANIVIFNDWKKLGHIADYMQDIGLTPKKILTWEKTNPFPLNIQRSFVSSQEHALWAVVPGAKWAFNKRPEVPYERGIFRHSVQKGWHPTKKPLALFKELITILSNPNDLVLDPFSGSGTTALACQDMRRSFLCFEREAEYVEKSRDLLKTRLETLNEDHCQQS